MMRTTVDIDDDVLMLARECAERERRTIGKVLSALARMALRPDAGSVNGRRNGLPVLSAARGRRPVTLDLVNQLRDDVSA